MKYIEILKNAVLNMKQNQTEKKANEETLYGNRILGKIDALDFVLEAIDMITEIEIANKNKKE
ncbi:hypothetical protein KAH94_04215 [bacterium]|nr:hypothetical protein [bacterium]